MSCITKRFLVIAIAMVAMVGLEPANAATVFAVTSSGLIRFDTAQPGTIVSLGPITGMIGGEGVQGLDFRPATGQLFALGVGVSSSRLYILDPVFAVATAVGPAFPVSLTGVAKSFDFHPRVDRIRVTTDSEQNFRFNPNDGSLTADDTDLVYADGDPNFGTNPDLGSVAYASNVPGTTTTTLYGIDTARNALVRIGGLNSTFPSPESGQVFTVGALGVNPTDDGTRLFNAFDIQTLTGVDQAFAALTTGGIQSALYSINLSTGAATLIGNIGGGTTLVRAMALRPETTMSALIYAVDSTNNLRRFLSSSPGSTIASTPITGLAAGETVLGIDFRPITGELFGLGSAGRLYAIDPSTAVATQRGVTGQFVLAGNSFGFDFNPVADRIRVAGDMEQNLRVNPNDGTSNTDTPLAYAAGDVNAGANPTIGGVGYSNNFTGAPSTTLFGIDTTLNLLVRIGGINGTPSANGGELFTVGSLGVNPTDDLTRINTGFDIRRVAGVDQAFAALTTNGTSSGLYSINLTTGAALFFDNMGALIRGIAIGVQTIQLSAPTYTVGESGPVASITVLRSGGSDGIITARFTTGNGTATEPADYTRTDQSVVFASGVTSQVVQIPIVNDAIDEPDETITITLTNPTGTGAVLGALSTAVLTISDNDVKGDVNGDGSINVVDLFHLINFLFAGGPVPVGQADLDASGTVNVLDVFYLVRFLFGDGPAPL